jgi:hypothetical protein
VQRDVVDGLPVNLLHGRVAGRMVVPSVEASLVGAAAAAAAADVVGEPVSDARFSASAVQEENGQGAEEEQRGEGDADAGAGGGREGCARQ